MNISITPKAAAIATLIAAGATAIALGPLNPPAGPVTETSPSLAEIDAKLDQLVLNQSGTSETSAPFESFQAPLVGQLTSNLSGTLIAEGRIYVESVTFARNNVYLFDGPGSIDNNANPIAGRWIAKGTATAQGSGGVGLEDFTSITVPVQQIVEDGLYAAWKVDSGSVGSVYILYKDLPE